jgi:hypothetical protein
MKMHTECMWQDSHMSALRTDVHTPTAYLLIFCFTMLLVARRYSVESEDHWWTGRDLEGSDSELIEVLSWNSTGDWGKLWESSVRIDSVRSEIRTKQHSIASQYRYRCNLLILPLVLSLRSKHPTLLLNLGDWLLNVRDCGSHGVYPDYELLRCDYTAQYFSIYTILINVCRLA